MPFAMRDTLQAVHYIAENYASHVGVVEKLNELLNEPKVKKEVKKKIFDSKQTKLKW